MKKILSVLSLVCLVSMLSNAQVPGGTQGGFRTAYHYFKSPGDSVAIFKVRLYSYGTQLTIENYSTSTDTLYIGYTTAMNVTDTSSTVTPLPPAHVFNNKVLWNAFWIKSSKDSTNYYYSVTGGVPTGQ